MFELRGKYNSCKVFTDLIEDSAVSQLTLLMNQEFCKDSKIRIMPDVHAGAGCTIGTTMTINDKIVPNLVGVDIIICIGKGNDDWNQSAPHGAGRLMSRSKARANVDMDEYKDTMKGIWTTSVNESTIDESPMAYKPMQSIIDNVKDTVDIVKIIKPVYNFKASE